MAEVETKVILLPPAPPPPQLAAGRVEVVEEAALEGAEEAAIAEVYELIRKTAWIVAGGGAAEAWSGVELLAVVQSWNALAAASARGLAVVSVLAPHHSALPMTRRRRSEPALNEIVPEVAEARLLPSRALLVLARSMKPAGGCTRGVCMWLNNYAAVISKR